MTIFHSPQKNEEIFSSQNIPPSENSDLSPQEILDAQNAFALLSNAGLSISLTDAVKLLLVRTPQLSSQNPISIGSAYQKYIRTFSPEQVAHIACVKQRVGKFVSSFGFSRDISEVSEREFLLWLNHSGRFSDKSFNNALNYCKTFFNWCCKKKQGFLKENPICDIEPRRLLYHEPEYISLTNAEQLFRILEKSGDNKMIAYAALSFFCGIRTAEIDRLCEDVEKAIRLDDGTIRISKPKGYLRGVSPRVFRATDAAIAWLQFSGIECLKGMDAGITRNKIGKLARKHGITLPHNAGRHSFVTYHIAWQQSPSQTETMVGTSQAMRISHYMGLATLSEGKKFFSIRPSHTQTHSPKPLH